MKSERLRRWLRLPLILLLVLTLLAVVGCSQDAVEWLELAGEVVQLLDDTGTPESGDVTEVPSDPIDKDGSYYSRDDVALYIHTWGKLPSNFITKSEAEALGWEGGPVEKYAAGCAIGGDRFGNREGLLPKKDGRTYTECDIDTKGADSRGAKRIVFSNDGLIYYTDDHYESFTLLYGGD